MCKFLLQHASSVIGMLSGWDRLRLRGTLRSIAYPDALGRFLSSTKLSQLHPGLIRHGIESLGSRDVMRFLGQRVPLHGNCHRNDCREIVSDVKQRPEGIRIKPSPWSDQTSATHSPIRGDRRWTPSDYRRDRCA